MLAMLAAEVAAGRIRNMGPEPEMWLGADEARHLGVHKSTVGRARRSRTHPAHPDAGGPRGVAGVYVTAPADRVIAWWLARATDQLQTGPRGGRPMADDVITRIHALAAKYGVSTTSGTREDTPDA